MRLVTRGDLDGLTCAVLVPEGYHPVASPPGYTTYHLNVLAGSAQSLANSDDPQYAWVKDSYTSKDARVPIQQKAHGDLRVLEQDLFRIGDCRSGSDCHLCPRPGARYV